MLNRPIFWVSSSKDDLREFPASARRKAGFQLQTLQRGDVPADFRPMRSIGPGVMEIRINTGDAYRIFYVARFAECIYVLHAFRKKAQRTSKRDIQLGRQRYRTLLKHRQG